MQPKENQRGIKRGTSLADIPELSEYATRFSALSMSTVEEVFSLTNTSDPALRSGVQGFLEASDEQMALLDKTLRGHLTPEFIAECESFVPKQRTLGSHHPDDYKPTPPIK